MKILGLATLYQLDIFYSKPHPKITRDLLIDPSMHFFSSLRFVYQTVWKKTTNYTEWSPITIDKHGNTAHTLLFTPSTHHTSWLESTVNWHLEVIAVRANYYRGAKMYTSFVVSFKAWLQSEKEEQAHSIQLSFCRALIADTSAHSITKSIL